MAVTGLSREIKEDFKSSVLAHPSPQASTSPRICTVLSAVSAQEPVSVRAAGVLTCPPDSVPDWENTALGSPLHGFSNCCFMFVFKMEMEIYHESCIVLATASFTISSVLSTSCNEETGHYPRFSGQNVHIPLCFYPEKKSSRGQKTKRGTSCLAPVCAFHMTFCRCFQSE